MKIKKNKIVFDANILFDDKEDQLSDVFDSSIEKTSDFIKKYKIKNVKLSIPQLVFDERVAGRLRQIDKQYQIFNSVLKKLGPLGCIKVKGKIFNRKKYIKLLNKNGRGIIKKYKVQIIPTAKVQQKIIIDRALQKKTAFCGGKGDNGFKDTLIWLSLLEDAEKNKDCNYLFITEDGTNFKENLCKDEFSEHSKADFFLIRGLSDLQAFLDKELNLNLKLEDTYNQVKQELLSLPGTITSEVSGYIHHNNPNILWSDSVMPFVSRPSFCNENNEKENFDFSGLEIKHILLKDDNQFNVILELSVIIKKESSNFLTTITYPFSESGKTIVYDVSLVYTRNPRSINIFSAVKKSIPYEF